MQIELSNLAQRMRGVETSFDGVKRELGTTNTYLHPLNDQGLKK
jgi:hypothetical protein